MLKRITIDSVLGGVAASQYFPARDEYQGATGVDPDLPIDESTVRSSGFLRPTAMQKFSGTEVTGVPMWFVTNPKTTNTYLYANDGKVHTIDSTLAMGTALNGGSALTTASGNGAAYYDNYAYFARNTDIARYGPLNGSASLTTGYWGTTLAKTALTNTTYPSVGGVQLPNHVMHPHSDNKLYIADVLADSTTNTNRGGIHYIETSKTTVEGDTDAGATYNALDLPYGWYPTALETYQTDLVIAAIDGTSTTVKQKNAKLLFWDTTSSSWSSVITTEFPDPLITGLRNVNGTLYVFSGNAQSGCRVTRFAGGYNLTEVFYDEDGLPPMHGAIDHLLNRILWGDMVVDPESAAVVKALGSKKDVFMKSNALHIPYRATSSNTTNQRVTAMKFIQHSSFAKPIPVIGWTDNAAKGLDKSSTTYTTSYWQSGTFRVGKPFDVVSVTIPLSQAVAANMTVTPKLWFDDASSSTSLTVINNTNYPSKRHIWQTPTGAHGANNFFLELVWSGTALCTVALPIEIVIDIQEEANG